MIFKTIEDVKKVFSVVNINNAFETIESYLDRALVDFVMPYISQDQWDDLLADFNSESTNEDHLALLKKVRTAIIHFAYYYYAFDGGIQLSDKGITRIESEEEKTAYSGQVREFKRARLRDGWNALDDLVLFLNAHMDVYSIWASSDEYEDIKRFFIWNSKLFRKHRQIKNLGVLDALEGCSVHVQEEVIRRNVGQDLYDQLLDELFEDDFSDDNQPVVTLIRKAIAHLVIARGIDEGLVDFSEEGATLHSFEDKVSGGDKSSPADLTRLNFIKTEALKKGESAIKELRDYLNDNASVSKYQSYFQSDLYDDPSSDDDDQKFTNQAGGTFFAK